MTSRGSVCLLGASPSASKTTVSVGLLRALADAGTGAAPFKAIATARQRDATLAASLASPLPHHMVAARLSGTDSAMHPLIVAEGRDRFTGRMRILASDPQDVALLCEDGVDVMSAGEETFNVAARAVRESLGALQRSFEYLVIEGAGSAVELPPDVDLANTHASRCVPGPIVLVAQYARGGSLAALVGTAMCLPPDLRARVRGVILGSVPPHAHVGYIEGRLRDEVGLAMIGVLPYLSVWEPPGGMDPESSAQLLARLVRTDTDLLASCAPVDRSRS
jgi:adenosylcobyric acid synthase